MFEKEDHPSSSSRLSALRQLGGDVLDKSLSLIQEGDRLPYDELWQDIMQNINKGQGTRDYIYITHSEIDRLEQQLNETDSTQGHATLAVFFTCGHYYTNLSFTKEVERLENDTAVSGIKMSETLSLIKAYYSRKRGMPLACPRCVLGALLTVS